jgi:hypothetical protein
MEKFVKLSELKKADRSAITEWYEALYGYKTNKTEVRKEYKMKEDLELSNKIKDIFININPDFRQMFIESVIYVMENTSLALNRDKFSIISEIIKGLNNPISLWDKQDEVINNILYISTIEYIKDYLREMETEKDVLTETCNFLIDIQYKNLNYKSIMNGEDEDNEEDDFDCNHDCRDCDDCNKCDCDICNEPDNSCDQKNDYSHIPEILYHGTLAKHVNNIKCFGLLKMNSKAVVLQTSEDNARSAALRHVQSLEDRIVVIEISARKMAENNISFFKVDYGFGEVYEVDFVNPVYIKNIN